MSGPRRRLAAGALLVALGWLLSPQPVPVYDGIGAPDEPYRYVQRPEGAKPTAAPTDARATSPLVGGLSSYGLNIATQETGPQLSLFLPPKALRGPGRSVEVTAVPQAPADQPTGARLDGNVYLVSFVDPAGAVALAPTPALALLSLRATTARQPSPVMEYRPAAGQPWRALKTSRAGADVYAATLQGPGQYALAFTPAAAKPGRKPLVPLLVLGGVVLLVAVVVVVRLRAPADQG